MLTQLSVCLTLYTLVSKAGTCSAHLSEIDTLRLSNHVGPFFHTSGRLEHRLLYSIVPMNLILS